MKKILLPTIAAIGISLHGYSQTLKLEDVKEGEGKYGVEWLVMPQKKGMELVAITLPIDLWIKYKLDATVFSENLDVKGEKQPFFPWATKTDPSFGKHFFPTDFETTRTIFSGRVNSGNVEFGCATFGEDLFSAPRWTTLFSFKKEQGFSQNDKAYETDYRLGASLSEDKKKMGVVYFPEGNYVKGNDAGNKVKMACYDASGKELWSSAGELPNEKNTFIRVEDTRTDNNGNVFAILNYVYFGYSYMQSKGHYALAIGPDFDKPQFKLISLNKPVVAKAKRTWVDHNGGYYVVGSADEKKGEEVIRKWNYYAHLYGSGNDKIEVVFSEDGNEDNMHFEKLPSIEDRDHKSHIHTLWNKTCVVDDKTALVLAITKNDNNVLYAIDKNGVVQDRLYISGRWGSPIFQKMGNDIFVLYNAPKGVRSVYETEKGIQAEGSYMLKYLSVKDGKISRTEHEVEGTEGIGTPDASFMWKGELYHFFSNYVGGKNGSQYKIAKFSK